LIDAAAFVTIHDKLGFSGYSATGSAVPLPEKFRKYAVYTKAAAKAFEKELKVP